MKEIVRDKTVFMEELKQKLEKAIKLEEFEEAARLRDQIRAVEGKKNE